MIAGRNLEDVLGMFRRVLTAIAVSTVMIGVAFAGPLEDGDAAYLRGDYATALTAR